MEDEYRVSPDGRFAAVFDGHGGGSVSKYLEAHLFNNFQQILANGTSDVYTDEMVQTALKDSLAKVDREVCAVDSMESVGSTVSLVYVNIQDPITREGSIISANIGDSRAVLSRKGKAIALTKVSLFSPNMKHLTSPVHVLRLIYFRITNPMTQRRPNVYILLAEQWKAFGVFLE